MKKKILKLLGEFLICILILGAALGVAYIGYSLIFGSWGTYLQAWINQLIG